MLELVPKTNNVYYVNLDGDLGKIVDELGLGLLPDEILKVKEFFQNQG